MIGNRIIYLIRHLTQNQIPIKIYLNRDHTEKYRIVELAPLELVLQPVILPRTVRFIQLNLSPTLISETLLLFYPHH